VNAYQAAYELLKAVHEAQIADLKLRDQAMRAAKSVCLNIAEAGGRTAGGDRRRVYAIARGEACEALAAVEIAAGVGECTEDAFQTAQSAAEKTYALLTGLMRL
jgi:four helix bundle protein